MDAWVKTHDLGSATEWGALSLKQNFTWTFAGNVGHVLSQFGMLLAIARLGTTEMTGQYGLALALTAPVFLFFGMSLRSVQVTDVADEYSFSDYALVRLTGGVFGLGIVALLVSVLDYSRETSTIILLIGFSKVVEGMSDIIYGAFQKHERMDKIAKSMLVKAGSSVAVFTTILWATGSLLPSILSISVVWLARLLAYDIPNLLRLQGAAVDVAGFLSRTIQAVGSLHMQAKVLMGLIVVSLPAGLSASLVSLNTNIPRYVLEWGGSTGDLGVFTVLAYPLTAGNIVISALSQSSLPRLARYYAGGEAVKFARLLKRLLLMAFGLAAAAFVVAFFGGEILIRLLFGEEYSKDHFVLIVLVLGMAVGFFNWFLNSSLHAMRAFQTMLVIQLGIVIFTIAVAFIAIPTYGLLGAAWVTVSVLGVQVAIKALIVARRLRLAYDRNSEQGLGT